MAMKEVVFVSAARTPFGMLMGSLADQRSQDLAACSMKEAVKRAGIDSSVLDVVIYSEAKQSSLPANVGRHGWLLAGLDENVAGFTQNALCAGALQTAISGFNKITGGEYEGILVGGIETNSQAQYYIIHPRYQFGPHNSAFRDPRVDVEINAQPVDKYGELSAAKLADIVASNYGLTREVLDDYTYNSHAKAVQAIADGAMKEAVVPVVKKVKKAEVTVAKDEGPQTTSLDKLLAMPAISECGTATKANTAPLADGSASLIMMSAEKAHKEGCKPLAKMISFGYTAGNPKLLERTTVKSIQKALNAAGVSLKDVDFIDMHEPSAAYSLAVIDKLGPDVAGKVNVDGGSLAFGHAGAATGGAMLVNMIYRLQRTGAKLGLVNVGALGGQSLSVVLQRM
ncbi:MAG: thiolase family protein [Syntrophomonadaceae bacterium]|nr:thiolase family protein [Syntrophomonadaceae bacterium]